MRKLAMVVMGLFVAVSIKAENGATWSKRFPDAVDIHSFASRPGGYVLSMFKVSGPCIALIDTNGKTGDEHCLANKVGPAGVTALPNAVFVWGEGRAVDIAAQVWITRLDPQLKQVWSRQIAGNVPFGAMDVAATDDGGAIAVGACRQLAADHVSPSGRASCAVKFGGDGSVRWMRVYDVTGEESFQAVRTVNDGYVVVGTGEPGYRILKVDRDGAVQWDHWFAGTMDYFGMDVVPGGDIVFAGALKFLPTSPEAEFIVVLGPDGKPKWQKQSSRIGLSFFRDVASRSDGSIIALGYQSDGTHLVAFSPAGDVLWQRSMVLAPQTSARIHAAHDGGVLLALDLQGEHVAELHEISAAGDPPACLTAVTKVADTQYVQAVTIPAALPIETSVAEAPAEDKALVVKSEPLAVTACLPAARVINTIPNARPLTLTAEEKDVLNAAHRIVDDRTALTAQVVSLLAARKFAELDAMAREFRDTTAELPDGFRKLEILYEAVKERALPFGTEEQHLKLVDDWVAALPSSQIAPIAAAQTYIEYAYEARGRSSADNVTDAAWKKHQELLSRATKLLQTIPLAAQANPGYYIAKIEIAGSSCANVEGIVHEPGFVRLSDFSMWRTAARFLLPRWCGSPDEYRQFAAYAASSTKAVYGDGLYSLIAFDAMWVEQTRQDSVAYHFDWPRIRQGFLDLIKRYPLNPLMNHRLAYAARFFDDRATAEMALNDPIAAWSSFAQPFWQDRSGYDRLKEWAATKPATPDFAQQTSAQTSAKSAVASPAPKLAPAASAPVASAPVLKKPAAMTSWIDRPASTWPPLFMLNDIRMQDGSEHKGSKSILVQTKDGAVAVSTVIEFGKLEVRPATSVIPVERRHFVPIQLDTFRSRLVSWTMAVSGHANKPFTVAEVHPKSQQTSHVVVLTLTAPKGAVAPQVLQPRKALGTATTWTRVYVIGCVAGSDPCVQTAFTGTTSGGGGNETQWNIGVALDEPVDWHDLAGSPVLDENGELVGIVASQDVGFDSIRDKQGVVRLDVEEISRVLARAGL